MKTGLGWYRHKPVAFLGGVQGMSAREIAVYAIVIDLIYQHGGGIHNDPKWIAGWFSDMGSAAVRATIASLLKRGKLCIDSDGFLSNKPAENELETQRKLSETREKTGRLGGVSSGKSRRKANEINDICEANPEGDKIRRDKIREEKKEYTPASFLTTARAKDDDDDFQDRILAAAGIDVTKDVTGKWHSLNQTWIPKRWLTDLALSEAEALAVVRDVMARHVNGPPASLAYFDRAMAESAGRRDAGLRPIRPPPESTASVFGDCPEIE